MSFFLCRTRIVFWIRVFSRDASFLTLPFQVAMVDWFLPIRPVSALRLAVVRGPRRPSQPGGIG